jgi:hypothetical protein
MDKSKRSRQIEKLVTEMLQQPTLQKAAEAAGINLVTAWRIRQTPEFQLQFLSAARRAHEHAGARTRYWSSSAVSFLARTMMDLQAPWSSRLRAAEAIMNHAHRATVQNSPPAEGEFVSEDEGVDVSRLSDEQLKKAYELALLARKKS